MKIENKKILFFGAGVIGSLYAGKLALSGQNITVLARGKRLEELQQKGLVLFSEKIGEEKPEISVISELKNNDIYDYVFVTLRNDNLNDVLPVLSQNQSKNFVFMVNTPNGYSDWIKHLGEERIIAAFPGAGGKVENGIVYYQLTPKIVQLTTFGEIDGKDSQRITALRKIIRQAGFPTAISKNMDSWQKSHVGMVCALACGLYYDGGNNNTLSKNERAITLSCKSLKENFAFLNKSKYRIEPFKLNVFRIIPTFLLGKILSKVFNTKWAETVMCNHALSARQEMEILTSGFIQLAESNRVELKYLKEMTIEKNRNGYIQRAASKSGTSGAAR
jgi:2-dehydropantoate 2-reductase